MKNQKVLKDIDLVKREVIEALKTSNSKLKKNKDIKIIAVSKRQPLERIISALDVGHREFGENQVQESLKKWPELKKKYNNVELHLIGPLQSNKVKDAIKIFDVIQTVDSIKLAEKINNICTKLDVG